MNEILFFPAVLIFFSSFLSLLFFRKVAKVINLVDVPTSRKAHQGEVPLVGGLSIFIVVLGFLMITPTAISAPIYVLCALILLIMGVIDDYLDLSFKVRLFGQLLVTLIMMYGADLYLHALHNVLIPGEINLGLFGPILTVIVVVGAINSFNMIDGIDGLLGCMSIVTFASMALLFYLSSAIDSSLLCIVVVIATLPYIFMNLGVPLGQKFKIFMGDAGSTVIGFTVVWMLLEGSQGEVVSFSPVTGLWVAAIPIMDAVSTIIRRLKKGQSPFKPDREHLHHILQRLGFGPKETLLVIIVAACSFAFVGIVGDILGVPEYMMLYGFIFCQLVYHVIMTRIWRVTVIIRRFLGISKRQKACRKNSKIQQS